MLYFLLRIRNHYVRFFFNMSLALIMCGCFYGLYGSYTYFIQNAKVVFGCISGGTFLILFIWQYRRHLVKPVKQRIREEMQYNAPSQVMQLEQQKSKKENVEKNEIDPSRGMFKNKAMVRLERYIRSS